MPFKNLPYATLAIVTALAAAPLDAHEGASGIVKERMTAMEHAGDSAKALGRIFRGDDDYEAARVASLAEKIHAVSGERLTSLFPEGTLDDPSEASEDIWSEWEKFSDYALALERTSKNLAKSASAGPEVAVDAFRTMIKTCKGCHVAFKED